MAVAWTVELFINDTWTDITSYVRDDPGANITFGVQQENGVADPCSCTLTLNNSDGRFTPRNTAGAYYPFLTRNVPVRVKVGTVERFHGEVSEFPVRWEPTGNVVWVPIVASGLLRRLARSNQLESTLKTAVLGLGSIGDITGYWPTEDAAGSTSVGSAIGGAIGTLTGTPVFAAVDPGVMSKPIPTWDGAAVGFTAATGSGTGFTAGALVTFPTAGALSGGEELFRVTLSSGTLRSWRVLYGADSLLMQIINELGVEVHGDVEITGVDGKTAFIKIEAEQNGANVDWSISALGVGVGGTETEAGTIAWPLFFQVGAGVIALTGGLALGHVIMADTSTALVGSTFADGLEAYAGETVGARMGRVASQAGISAGVTTGPDEPAEMGVQLDGSALEVMRAAEAADVGGILRDNLDTSVGLTYITRTARYNDQQPLFALDYAAGHLTMPIEPTDDDQVLRNDVTVNRVNGSTARRVLESGALSVQDYPNGVGPYRHEATLGTYLDSELPYVAGWLRANGTVDETRWPRITVDLVKNPGLVAAFDLLRPGSRVEITNLPTISGVASVNLHVIGWTEWITTHRRVATLNCVTATPYRVIELDDATFGELDVMRLAL